MRSMEPLNADALLEFIEVRRLFEPATAALAASRITEDGLAEVAAQLDAMTAARDDVATFSRLDIAFHRTVNFVTGNSAVASLLTSLSTQTALARIPSGLFDRNAADTVVSEHTAIHAALASRDPALAQAAALIHVDTTEKWLRRCLTLSALTGVTWLASGCHEQVLGVGVGASQEHGDIVVGEGTQARKDVVAQLAERLVGLALGQRRLETGHAGDDVLVGLLDEPVGVEHEG